MILIAAVLLTLGALLFTLLVRSKDLPEAESPSPFQHLDELKVRIYENLRDLPFEYRLGKLSDEDYQKTKQELRRELAGVMAQVDQVKQGLPAVAEPVKKSVPANVCVHCGAKFDKPLKFCGECGKPMTGEAV